MFIFVLFIFTSMFVFSNEDCLKSIEQSNVLLEKAYRVIENLEKENSNLKSSLLNMEKKVEDLVKEAEDYKVLLYKAQSVISENNKMLEVAYKRIEDDQREIVKLRGHIDDLIKTGVEVKTHKYEFGVTAGYPVSSIGFFGAYNLAWFPKVGVVAGANFLLQELKPLIYIGVKINVE